MNALVQNPEKLPGTPTFPKASPSLTRLLTTEGGSLGVVDEITAQPALHAEAIALVPELEAHVAAAGPDGVRSALSSLFAVFPQPQRTPEEWAAWWMIYMDDLEMFPAWALEAAVRDYRRDPASEFFPKPGPLRALANQHAIVAVKALGRARMAAKQAVRPLIAAERSEEVRGVVQGLVAKQRGEA